jgi:acyl-CoA thioesterase
MGALEKAIKCTEKMLRDDRASAALGITAQIPAVGSAVANMRVRDDMVNGFKVCHGGLIFALADSAFAFACNGYGEQAVLASAQIEFLRPAALGDELRAVAKEDYKGRRSAHYSVTVKNQNGAVVALFRGRSVTTGAVVLDG